MDMSDGAKINGMDQHIVETVKRWLKYTIFEGDSVAVAQIGASNFIHLPMMTVGEMTQRSALASRIKPIVHGESNPMKGIHLAEKEFQKEGGLIISLSYKDWEEVYIGANERRTLLNVWQKKLKIVHIVLQKDACHHGYCDLKAHGQYLQVSEDSLSIQHEIRIISIDTALEEVIATFFSTWSHSNVSTTTILQKELLIDYKAEEGTSIPITVSSSDQFRRLEISVHFLFGLHGCQLRHNFPQCNDEKKGRDEELNTLWISYPCNVNSTKNLYIKCPNSIEEQYTPYAFVRVAETFEANVNMQNLKFSCFACQDKNAEGLSSNTLEHKNSLCEKGDNHLSWNTNGPHPVIIMSQIKENNESLENVTIMITAEDISYQRNTSKHQREVIKLHDGGWGADGVNRDSIYSGYFYPTGDFYNHCRNNSTPCNISLECSVIGYGLQHEKFQMQIRGPPFQFQKFDEAYPPDKIRDLKGKQEGTSSNLYITWTAPGRSLEKGKVSEYVFQIKNNCTDNSSITNGYLEDEISEHRDIITLHFNLSSSPRNPTSYTLDLKDIMNKMGESSQPKVCYVIEAKGESQMKTQSNCVCTMFKYDVNTSYVTYVILISLSVLAICLSICIWYWRRRRIRKYYAVNGNGVEIPLNVHPTQEDFPALENKS
ncbi:uncharacterized protein LOC124168234 isoform X2 [Ischnura elegans]|nr:uncharacterized protein LOC124168234 isoform X2 [Ischnura elegans]